MWRWRVQRWRGGAPARGCHRRVDRLPLTAGDIAAATGGRLEQGDSRQDIERISIDSRTIGASDFFVAIRGDRFDGHDFVAAALARGAVGVLIDATAVAATAPSAVRVRADGMRIVTPSDHIRGAAT